MLNYDIDKKTIRVLRYDKDLNSILGIATAKEIDLKFGGDPLKFGGHQTLVRIPSKMLLTKDQKNKLRFAEKLERNGCINLLKQYFSVNSKQELQKIYEESAIAAQQLEANR